MKHVKILTLVLCFSMILNLFSGTIAVASGTSASHIDNVMEFKDGKWVMSEMTEPKELGSVANCDDDDVVTVIVVMEAEPLIRTAIKAGVRSDYQDYFASSKAKSYEKSLLQGHAEAAKQVAALCNGKGVSGIGFNYTAVLNGFSISIPYGKLDAVGKIDGVKRVYVAESYALPEDMGDSNINMSSSNPMIGADVLFESAAFEGADGSGMTVAILDTGLDTDHEAFSVMPEIVDYTQEDVQSIMDGITLSSGISDANITYLNAKVPYAYDYGNADTDVNGDYDHGVHVAGTVAGNNGVDFFGVAPNAQLLIMKIFPDGSGSASDDIITAGLDDSVKLGADSINMSLGSPAGFSFNRATEDEVYNNCYDAGLSLMIAAGNETSAAYGNQYGNSLAMADSVDNAIVGSPSTGYGTISVASVENEKLEMDYFKLGDNTSEAVIGFFQMMHASTYALGNIYSGIRNWSSADNYVTYEYVVIPNLGYEEDYEGIDVTGKIALISRGVSTFEDKLAIAMSHGAKAAIIYNTQGGEVFNPAYNNYVGNMCGISYDDAQSMIAAENKTVTFGPSTTNDFNYSTPAEDRIPWRAFLTSPNAGRISSFSSVGPAPDLAMKPEIAAPGGNIVSSVIGGGYGAMSGTSMATPHMAGAAAVIRNYVVNVLGITDPVQVRDISNALMMSTAIPATNSSGDEYGTRWQGAGLVNLLNATTSAAYLTVPRIDASNPNASITLTSPKAELGWNENGVYTFTFTINSISDTAQTYAIDVVSLCEGITEQYGVKFVDGITRRISSDDFTVSYGTTAANGVVTVNAGETVDVEITLALSVSYKAWLDANYVNGNYVDGYVYLTPAEDDGVSLTLPYLGFYGDWFDAGTVVEGDPGTNYQLAPTQFATTNSLGSGYYLGENSHNDEDPYNYDRLAFSPRMSTGDAQIFASLITLRRNLTDFSVRVTDPDASDDILWEVSSDYVRKAYLIPLYGVYNTQIVANGWTGRAYNEETGLYDGEYLETGKYYDYTISGNLGQSEAGYTEQTFKVWLDSNAPQISNITTYVDEADGKFKLSFDVSDDHYIRQVDVIDSTNMYLLTYTTENFAEIEEQGSTSRVIMDLNGLCQFLASNGLNPGRVKLSVSDYSLNKGEVYVDLGPQYMSLSNMTIAVDDSQEAVLRILPAHLADSTELTWATDDESIATVDSNGTVTGVAYGGTILSVTANTGLTAFAMVTIGDETLPPEEPEMPDANPTVNKPTAEAFPRSWNNAPAASDDNELAVKFEADGLWYKITGADTAQLIRNPSAAEYGNPYPGISAELVIPQNVTYNELSYTVTSIAANAMCGCSTLTSIVIPSTVRAIGQGAFSFLYNLRNVELNEGLQEVGMRAFSYVPGVKSIPSTLKYIGQEAFNGTGITELSFGDSLVCVEKRAFMGCNSLTTAELPLEAADAEGLFMNCSSLTSVEIEPGITRLAANVFFSCSLLADVDIPEGVTELGKSAFQSSGLSSIKLPDTVTTLGDFAFAGLNNCFDFVIPDTVTYVGSNIFYWCRYVRSITIGENVAYIGTGFSTFFMHPDVTQVIPEVKSANSGAALRRSGYLGPMMRDGKPYDAYAGAPFIVDGLTYMPITASEVMVTTYDSNSAFGVVTIPEQVTCDGDEATYTVTAVADRLFSSKYNITEVHLPDTITTVGERAFDQIHALEYINIPANLTTLSGIQAFGYGGWNTLEWSGIWNPDTLEIPGTITTWNQCAFSGNHYTKIILGDGLKMVGEYGCSNNNSVEEVFMADSVEYIKNNAFSNCPVLTSICLPANLRYIGDQAFQNVPLASIELPYGLEHIGSGAFEAYVYDYSVSPSIKTYVGIPEVSIPGTVTGMGWNVFDSSVIITTVLGSQRNMVIERNNIDPENLPTVVWDGRTSIPAGDYSVIPAGAAVEVNENVRIEGVLYVEGTLIINGSNNIIAGDDNIVCTGEIVGSELIESELAAWDFDTERELDDWYMLDEDGDGAGWTRVIDCTEAELEGIGSMRSVGCAGNDNWLVSPLFTADYSLSFILKGANEKVGFYVSTDNGETWSDEIMLFTGKATAHTYAVNTAAYYGSDIRIAFRHYGEGTGEVAIDLVKAISVMLGDVNCSGQISSADALLILRHALDIFTILEDNLMLADMNADGIVDVADALLVLREFMFA